jgi:hypothetical protein
MSRLTDIIDNHENLEQLFALLKHYGVSAEFVTASLLNELQNEENGNDGQNDQGGGHDDSQMDDQQLQDLTDDLKQFYARF